MQRKLTCSPKLHLEDIEDSVIASAVEQGVIVAVEDTSSEPSTKALNVSTTRVSPGVMEEEGKENLTLSPLDADFKDLGSSVLCVTGGPRVFRSSSVCDEKIAKATADIKEKVDDVFMDNLFDPRLSPIRPDDATTLGGDQGPEEIEVGNKTYEELVSGISAICDTSHTDGCVFENDFVEPVRLHNSCTVVSSTPDIEMLKDNRFQTSFDVKDSEKYPGHQHLSFIDLDFPGKGSGQALVSCPPSFIGSSSHSVVIGQRGRFKDVDVSRQTEADATLAEEISDTGPDVLGLDGFTTLVDSDDEDLLLMTVDEWQTVIHNSTEGGGILEGKDSEESQKEAIEKGKKRKPSEAFVVDLEENILEVEEFLLGELGSDLEKRMSQSDVKKQKTEMTESEDNVRAIVKKQIADLVREVSLMNDEEKLKLTDEATSEYLQRRQTDASEETACTDTAKPSPEKGVSNHEVTKTASDVSYRNKEKSQSKESSQEMEGASNANIDCSANINSLQTQQSESIGLERQQTDQGNHSLPSFDPFLSQNVLPTTGSPSQFSIFTPAASPGRTMPSLDVSLRSVTLSPSPKVDAHAISSHQMDEANLFESTNGAVLSALQTDNNADFRPIPVIASSTQKPRLNEEQGSLPESSQINTPLLPADKTSSPRALAKTLELSVEAEHNNKCKQNSNLPAETRPTSVKGKIEVSVEKSGKVLGVDTKPLFELPNLPSKTEQISGYLAENNTKDLSARVPKSPVKQTGNLYNETIVEKPFPVKRKASPVKAVRSNLNGCIHRAKLVKSSYDAHDSPVQKQFISSDKVIFPVPPNLALKCDDTGLKGLCANKDSSPKVTSLVSLSTSGLTSVMAEQNSTALKKQSYPVFPKGEIATSGTAFTKANLNIPRSKSVTEAETITSKSLVSEFNSRTPSAIAIRDNDLSASKSTITITQSLGENIGEPKAALGKTVLSTVAWSAGSVNSNLAAMKSTIPVTSALGKVTLQPISALNKAIVSAVNETSVTSTNSVRQVEKVAHAEKLAHVGLNSDVLQNSSGNLKNLELKKGDSKKGKLSLGSDEMSNSKVSGQSASSNPDVIYLGTNKADQLGPVAFTGKIVDKIPFQRQASLHRAVPRKVSKSTIQRQVSLGNVIVTKVEKPTVDRLAAAEQQKHAADVSKVADLAPPSRSMAQYIYEDNELIQQVKKRWDCKVIPSPEINLTCANYWRRKQGKGLRTRNAMLEGDFRFSPLIERMKSKAPVSSTVRHSKKRKHPDSDGYLNPSDGYWWDRKRARYDQHVQSSGEVSASIKFQIEKLEQDFRERSRQIFLQENRKKTELNMQHELQMEKMVAQQREEMYARGYDHFNFHRSFMRLRQQHQLCKRDLEDIHYCNLQRLAEETKQQITKERKNYFKIAEQLEQLMNKEKAKSYQHKGQNITYKMVNLVKAPCRSNNHKKSWVKVYLPADVGSSIIREDLIYDAFYMY